MNIDQAKLLVSEAFKEDGRTLSRELKELAFTPQSRAAWDGNKLKIAEITNAVQRKFWRAVENGECIGNPAKVEAKLGKSVEEQFNSYDGPFLDLARAYWTYKIEIQELMHEHGDLAVSHALQGLEIKLRQLFFPTPDMLHVSEEMIKSAQLDNLSQFAPSIDAFKLIEDNAIARKGRTENSGCMGAIVGVALIGTVAIFILRQFA